MRIVVAVICLCLALGSAFLFSSLSDQRQEHQQLPVNFTLPEGIEISDNDSSGLESKMLVIPLASYDEWLAKKGNQGEPFLTYTARFAGRGNILVCGYIPRSNGIFYRCLWTLETKWGDGYRIDRIERNGNILTAYPSDEFGFLYEALKFGIPIIFAIAAFMVLLSKDKSLSEDIKQ